jgi:hypothetical protein
MGFVLQCTSPVLDTASIRCGAKVRTRIRAKRTCRGRRERVDLTKMTHKGHGQPNFAVMHNTAPVQRCGRV